MTRIEKQPYLTNLGRRILVERLTGVKPPLPQALHSIVQELAHWQPTAPLRYAGDPPRQIELTESALASYLAEFESARRQNIPEVFYLSNHSDNPQLELFFDVEPALNVNIEYAWFPLPTTPTEGTLQPDRIIELMPSVCLGFGAHHGYIEDERLLLLYRVEAASHKRANVPLELRQFVPEHPMPEDAAGTLPQLLFPGEFNRRYVPEAVWWINFWDRVQVETVGQTRIRAADWAQIIDQPGGALVLIATDDPTEVTCASHLAQLRQIVGHLNLRELQEQYRFR